MRAVALLLSILALSQTPRTADPEIVLIPQEPRTMISDPLTMVFGKWTLETRPLRVNDFGSLALLIPTDEAILERALERGTLQITGGNGRPNSSPPGARLFIVFRGPLTAKVRLAEPDGQTIVYVQESGETFRRYPPEPPLLNRFVDLEPDLNADYVNYMKDLGQGRSGGSIFIGRD